MINRALPYCLEDRTGVFSGTDLDDLYDRLFLRVAPTPAHLIPPHAQAQSPFSIIVYPAARRSSLHKNAFPYAYGQDRTGDRALGMRAGEPAVVLHFGPRGALGNVTFLHPSSSSNSPPSSPLHEYEKHVAAGPALFPKETIPMGHWLRKTSLFGGSHSRKFRASDGQEYRWLYRSVDGQEWSLVDAHDRLVAHYNLKPPTKPAYNTSGNMLTILDPYVHLAVDILASLTIMRHIVAHNL